MKVCLFSGDITRCGGTERAASALANALAAQDGFEVCILSLVEQSEAPFFPVSDAITRSMLNDVWLPNGPGYLKLIPRLRRYLKQNAIDVLIDIDIILDILSVPAALGLSTRVVSWEHFNFSVESSSFLRRLVLKEFSRRTAAIVTLTEQDAEAFRRALRRSGRILSIYNSVDRPAAESLTAWEKKENAIVSVGRLAPEKGCDYLLEVAKSVLPEHPDWKWYVVGDGEERGMLERGIARFHLEGQLLLAGFAQDVAPYLDRSKVYVLTSRYEGLPICLLEAKAHQLPIVSFDIHTGPREIVTPGINGCLVPAYDCQGMAQTLNRLIEDEAQMQSFAAHTWDDIGKFELPSILDKWMRLLAEIAAK